MKKYKYTICDNKKWEGVLPKNLVVYTLSIQRQL